MKALILSGGKGARLRPITHTSAKQLIPIANKPIIFYGLEAIRAAGIKDVGVVVGETKKEIMQVLKNGRQWGLKISYIEQEAPLGLAHAVKVSRKFLRDEPFAMYLGDNIIMGGIKPFVDEFKKKNPDSLVLLAHVKNPCDFGVAELKEGKVVNLVEKPRHPRSDLALVGVYMFNRHIFKAIENIRPSWRNELEITDAISHLIKHGFNVLSHTIKGWWKDTGKLEDLLEANRIILDTLESSSQGKVDKYSRIYGKVVIEKGALISHSVIRGPVIIGKKCRIGNSYIGPFTSLCDNVSVENTEIEHSIIMEDSSLENLGRIEDSLIGKGVRVYKCEGKPRAFKFMLGDSSQVAVT